MKVLAIILCSFAIGSAAFSQNVEKPKNKTKPLPEWLVEVGRLVKTFDREIVTYHYENRAEDPSLPKGYINMRDPLVRKPIHEALAGSMEVFRDLEVSGEGNMFGNGIYTAKDPATSRQYGSLDPVLYVIPLRKGARYIDVRVSKNTLPTLIALEAKASGCNVSSYGQLMSTQTAPCRQITNEIVQKLNVAVILYSWNSNSYFTHGECNAEYPAFNVIHPAGVNWKNVNVLTKDLPPAGVEDSDLKERRIIGKLALKNPFYPAIWNIPLADDAEANQYVRENFFGCGAHKSEQDFTVETNIGYWNSAILPRIAKLALKTPFDHNHLAEILGRRFFGISDWQKRRDQELPALLSGGNAEFIKWWKQQQEALISKKQSVQLSAERIQSWLPNDKIVPPLNLTDAVALENFVSNDVGYFNRVTNSLSLNEIEDLKKLDPDLEVQNVFCEESVAEPVPTSTPRLDVCATLVQKVSNSNIKTEPFFAEFLKDHASGVYKGKWYAPFCAPKASLALDKNCGYTYSKAARVGGTQALLAKLPVVNYQTLSVGITPFKVFEENNNQFWQYLWDLAAYSSGLPSMYPREILGTKYSGNYWALTNDYLRENINIVEECLSLYEAGDMTKIKGTKCDQIVP